MKFIHGFFCFFLLQMTTLFSDAPRYQLIDLGLQQYSYSNVTSLNNNGYICGYYEDNGYHYVFVVDPDKKIASRWENFDWGDIFINNQNELYASFNRSHEEHHINFYYEVDDEYIYKWINQYNYFQFMNLYCLGMPEDRYSKSNLYLRNVIWDVNDLGQALIMNKTSYSQITDENSYTTKTWYFNKDKFQKIESPNFEAGLKINNHYQVLGCFNTGSALYKNRMHHTSIYNLNDKSVQIIDLPGSSFGKDINDLGQVVGNFYHPAEDMTMGFLYEPSGEITYLLNFSPWSINNNNQIIGEFIYAEDKNQPALLDRGILYKMASITSLVDDQGKMWDSLDELVEINDKGYIIGNGTVNGKSHGFLLKRI